MDSVLSCVAYSVMSNCMVLSNRYLVGRQYFGFKEKSFVIFIQAILAVLVLRLAKHNRWVHFNAFDVKIAKAWSPVTLFFIAMLYTSTEATSKLPIHIVLVFKNLTNIVIVSGEKVLFQENISILVVFSLLIMLFGALMASTSDPSGSSTTMYSGYVWMILNCMCTAGYVLYMRFATSKSKIQISRFGMAYYNNAISAILLFPIMVVTGDAITVLSNPLMVHGGFLLLLTASGVLGVGLNLASYWCVSVTSATTYATVGALNKLPSTFIGVLLLGEALQPSTAMYVSCGMLGGILYGYAKFIEKNKAKTPSIQSEDKDQLLTTADSKV